MGTMILFALVNHPVVNLILIALCVGYAPTPCGSAPQTNKPICLDNNLMCRVYKALVTGELPVNPPLLLSTSKLSGLRSAGRGFPCFLSTAGWKRELVVSRCGDRITSFTILNGASVIHLDGRGEPRTKRKLERV